MVGRLILYMSEDDNKLKNTLSDLYEKLNEEMKDWKSLSDLYEKLNEMKDWKYSKEITFPVEITNITCAKSFNFGCDSVKPGAFVSIRPCDDPKTYLGVYVGSLIPPFNELPDVGYNIKTKELKILPPRTNPAIFVFDLKKIVWGCESWWGAIEDENDLKQISDTDIQNIWYVQVLKSLQTETK
jgi:hypothetical protein